MIDLVVVGQHIVGHPSVAVNWASMAREEESPANARKRDSGQVGIRLNEGLLIPIASVDETVVPFGSL